MATPLVPGEVVAHLRDAAVNGPGALVIVEGPPGSGVTAWLARVGEELASAGVRAITDEALDDAQRLAGRAAGTPLALVADDAHRAGGTAHDRLLAVAAALRGARGVVLVGRRASGAAGRPPDGLRGVADLVATPPPLGAREIERILTDATAAPPPDGAVGAAHAATGGLPAAVAALAEDLAASVAGPPLGPPAMRHRAEQALARAVRERVPDAVAGAVLDAVAVLGPEATARRAVALVDAPAAAVRRAVDDLLLHGFLVGDAEALALFTPRAADALARSTGIARGDVLRGAAADLLAQDGAPVAAARLLLAVDPADRADRVAILEAAAAQARDDEDPALATRILARLLAEPPASARRAGVLVTLGTTQVTSGNPAGIETLRRALNEARDPKDVADAAAALGWALAGDAEGPTAEQVLRDARARVSDDAGEHGVALDVQIADMSGWDPALAEARREALDRLGGEVGRSPLARSAVIAARGVDALRTCRPAAETAGLCQDALADGALAESPRGAPTALAMALFLGYAGRPAPGVDQADHVAARLRAIGLPNLVRPAVAFRGALRFMQGRLAEAEEDLRAVAGAPWLVRSTPLMTAFLIRVLLARDDDAAAACVLADLDLEGGDLQDLVPHAPFLHARALLRERRGDARGAIADLRDCGRRLERGAWTTPTVAPWRSALAVLLADLGESEEARTLADEELRLAERVGAPETLARALRGRAAIEPPAARSLLVRAVAVARDAAPLEHVGALVDLGAATHAAGDDAAARTSLHAALAAAQSLGAAYEARRSADLLRRAGGRARRAGPAGLDVLTRAERRVAELAAMGRTNTEISEELVVSRKTVETHLGAAFRKLGVTARTQLPGAFERASAPRGLP